MARPIAETPILTGEDAVRFEKLRMEVKSLSKEQRAENSRKLKEAVKKANIYNESGTKHLGREHLLFGKALNGMFDGYGPPEDVDCNDMRIYFEQIQLLGCIIENE